MNPNSNIYINELENRIKALKASVAREKNENRRKEGIINKLHLDKNELRKKLRDFGMRTKKEESRNKELTRVNKRLMSKIRVMENNYIKSKVVMRKNTFTKGKEMENVKVVVSERENFKKELVEIKRKYEARMEKLNKEIIRKESIINRLHEEKNAANKKSKEEENMKEIEGIIVENLKKENYVLKKENKNLLNENNKLKSENKFLEIEMKKSEVEREQLCEDKKRYQEIVWFKTITSPVTKTVSMKQKLEVSIDTLKENNVLDEKNERLSYRVEKISCTEENLKTATSSKKLKKRRIFKFFCF